MDAGKKILLLFLWISVVAALFISVLAVIGASQWGLTTDPFPPLARKQIIWIVIGVFSLLFLWLQPLTFEEIVELAPVWGFLNIVLLFLVLVMGRNVFGSKRWIVILGFSFQPSELAKVVVPLLVVYGYRHRQDWRRWGFAAIMILSILVLTLVEPDLGTTLLLLIEASAVVFYFFVPLRFVVVGLAAGILALPAVVGMLKDYQRRRLLYFLNPSLDPHGHGYNIIQSLIAVGSGGLKGMGLYNATQAKFGFLPVATADFLFAAYAQAFGFLGVVALVVTYTLMIVSLFLLSYVAKDEGLGGFTFGIATMFLFSFMVNVGMNMGLMPVTGIPLPLFSYGGSQVAVSFVALGLITIGYLSKATAQSSRELKF